MAEKSLKKLVVYYSLDGNTRFVAKAMADTVGADILELKPKKDIPAKGFLKMFLGGMQAMRKKKPELNPFDKNPGSYDLLYIGTPVWASRQAPALNTFFSGTGLKGKKIGLFCCYGGQAGKTFDEMKEALDGNTLVGEIEFRNPLTKDKDLNAKRASDWAREIAAKNG